MGQVIQLPRVERHVITKQGEMAVTININLTLTLDHQGGVRVTASSPAEPPPQEDRVQRVVPELEMGELLDFGKNA